MKKNIIFASSALLFATLTTSASNAFYVEIINKVTQQRSLKVDVEVKTKEAFCKYGGADKKIESDNEAKFNNSFNPTSFPDSCKVTDDTPYFFHRIDVEDIKSKKKWHIVLKEDQVKFHAADKYGVTVNIVPGVNADTVNMTVQGTSPDGTTDAGTLSVGPL